MEELLKKYIELKKAIKELEEAAKVIQEQLEQQLNEKVEYDDYVISPVITKRYKFKDDIDISEVIGKGYLDAIKVDAKKLYEIADDENLKKSIEIEEKKIIMVRRKNKNKK